MQDIEPFYNWHYLYNSQDDPLSPFADVEYNEFAYDKTIYNYYIHPQWDEIGSSTLYIKVLFADYESGYMIIELIGEWNDAVNNDIMFLKRNIIDIFIENGIYEFIVIGENVLNFFYEDESYYEEWAEDIADKNGWIVFLNLQPHVYVEFKSSRIPFYTILIDELQSLNWRVFKPDKLHDLIDNFVIRKLDE
jgi:hypothetical protein